MSLAKVFLSSILLSFLVLCGALDIKLYVKDPDLAGHEYRYFQFKDGKKFLYATDKTGLVLRGTIADTLDYDTLGVPPGFSPDSFAHANLIYRQIPLFSRMLISMK